MKKSPKLFAWGIFVVGEAHSRPNWSLCMDTSLDFRSGNGYEVLVVARQWAVMACRQALAPFLPIMIVFSK